MRGDTTVSHARVLDMILRNDRLVVFASRTLVAITVLVVTHGGKTLLPLARPHTDGRLKHRLRARG